MGYLCGDMDTIIVLSFVALLAVAVYVYFTWFDKVPQKEK